MPEISVITPVYNVKDYLPACVKSVLSQSFSEFEMILVDDGSTDGSGAICDEFAKKDARVRVLHQKNAGQSAARNRGVEAAKADLLCFIDSDDIVNPILLETFCETMLKTGAGAVVSDRVRGVEPPDGFFEPVKPETECLYINEETLLRLFDENDTVYWTLFPCLIKKSVYEQYPLAEGRVMEDNAVACKWLTAAKTVARIKIPLYFYRENPSGTMQAAFSKKNLDYLWALEEQLSFYDFLGFTKMQGAVAKHYVETAIWFSKRIKNELNDKKLAKQVISKAVHIRNKYAAVSSFSLEEDQKLFKAAHPVLHRIKKKLV